MIQITRREQVGALVLGALLVLGLVFRIVLAPKPDGEVVIEAPPSAGSEMEMAPTEILVHVAGAVARPGVYSLPQGARIIEALEAAGGALAEADPHALNLAEPLFDGRKITVPLVGEGGASSTIEAGKVNINTATATELEKLPGIGPAKAASIVRYREQHGPFISPEGLTEVAGIGEKVLEGLREYITIY